MKARSALIALFLVLSLGIVVGCDPTQDVNEGDAGDQGLAVVASIYPLGYFAERVGGELVSVEVLIGPGVEAHGFEPTASNLRSIEAADVVVMNGLELEPWLERALDALAASEDRLVIETADQSQAIAGFVHEHGAAEGEAHDEGDEDEGDSHEEEEEAEEGEHADEAEEDEHEAEEDEHEEEAAEDEHESDEGDEDHADAEEDGHGEEFDPHVWLDPTLATVQVERIRDAFAASDPDNAAAYTDNAAAVIAELQALDSEFKEALAQCRHDHFVTSHAAYGYLANRYAAEQIPVSGLSPEVEPSPRQLAAISDQVRDLGLQYVMVEPVLSEGLAQTVARENDVELIPIHAIGSVTEAELEEFGDYFGLMRNNLNSLTRALECS